MVFDRMNRIARIVWRDWNRINHVNPVKRMNPVIIQGGCHADDRGALRFCNDFDMSAVKRFYTIANSAEQPVRGWIGHRRETKWFFPIKGVTIVEVEPMTDNHEETWRGEDGVDSRVDNSTCSARSPRSRYLLDVSDPAVLKVPPENWFCIKQDGNAEVMVFSDCRVGEFDDDFRRPVVKEVFGQD